MHSLVLVAVFALSSAAQLPSRSYIPQDQGGGGYQNFQSSQGSAIIGGGGSGDTGNRRPQQEVEKNAAILKQEQEIGEEGSSYHFGYETSNGIRAEEAGNPAQSQGGFSYQGDDGNTYTVTYTSGEGGFRPQGEHLPVAPPTPDAILEALKQNEKDEAAGIFDDGKYRPDVHGGGQNTGHGSSGGNLGSGGHQGGFNANTGYQY